MILTHFQDLILKYTNFVCILIFNTGQNLGKIKTNIEVEKTDVYIVQFPKRHCIHIG